MSQPDNQHSVSEWLTTVHASQGEAETAWRQLWNRYVPQVTALARARLTDRRQPLVDEDDVVVAVFQDLFRGVQAGRFPQLSNRDELQRILRTITWRRAIDAARRNEARAGQEAGESALPAADGGPDGDRPLERVAAESPSPELSLVACETLAGLLDSLQDDTLRQVALLRIFSSPDEEIAGAIGLSVRTVQRKVQVIAQRWRDAARSQAVSIEDLRQAFRSWRCP